MASDDVKWLTQAISNAFSQDDSQKVKAAWSEAAPALDIRSARSQQGIRAWADQLKLLRKREAMAATGERLMLLAPTAWHGKPGPHLTVTLGCRPSAGRCGSPQGQA